MSVSKGGSLALGTAIGIAMSSKWPFLSDPKGLYFSASVYEAVGGLLISLQEG